MKIPKIDVNSTRLYSTGRTEFNMKSLFKKIKSWFTPNREIKRYKLSEKLPKLGYQVVLELDKINSLFGKKEKTKEYEALFCEMFDINIFVVHINGIVVTIHSDPEKDNSPYEIVSWYYKQ